MTNLGILGHKDSTKRICISYMIKYIQKYAPKSETKKEKWQYEIRRSDRLHESALYHERIKIYDTEEKRAHNIFLLEDNLEKSRVFLGVTAVSRILNKIVLFFSDNIDLDKQLEFFDQLLEFLPEYLYIILDVQSDDYYHFEDRISESIKSNNREIEIIRLFAKVDIEKYELLGKLYITLGRRPSKKEIQEYHDQFKGELEYLKYYSVTDTIKKILYDYPNNI